MERVVTINLNGNPYQLEEPAYDALRAYMGRAEAALAANPDKAEIIRDFEQAIADKCSGYLSSSKSIVNAQEMARILEEMGSVEGEQEAPPNDTPRQDDDERPQRRLYRIYDRHAWTGVSAGLSAYLGIDVAWVRAIWIVSALVSGGFTVLVYLVLIFAMPVAATSAEMAAAHGAPFNAQEIVDRAKREYDNFATDSARAWRREERHWRRTWRRQQRAWNDSSRFRDAPATSPAQPAGYLTRILAGFLALIFSIITAALLIVFLVAVLALISTGAILGWAPPFDAPIWLAIIVLAIIYAAISSPFGALRRSSYATLSGHNSYEGGADGLVTLLLVGLALWLSYLYWPDARDLMQSIPDTLSTIAVMLRDN